jgi:NADH dehydrogenase [ubiquinone] 1 alpha subcomplex assembly factor 6
MLLTLSRTFIKENRLSYSSIRNACQKTAAMVANEEKPKTQVDHYVEQTKIIAPDQLEQISSHHYCMNQVRRYDRENYLAALCIDSKLLKRIVFALRAFNVELSLIRDLTTNSDRAKLRFHFWSRLIDEIIKRNGNPLPDVNKDVAYYKHTPVAKELLDLFHMVDIDGDMENYMRDLVGARVSSKVLGYKPFDDMRELELYCSKSNTPIYQLAWRMDFQLNNVFNPEIGLRNGLESVSNDLGIAQGLSNVIRGIPYNSTKNCCYVPQDLLEKYHLTNRDFVTKQLDGNKIRSVVEALANRCQELSDKVQDQLGGLPKCFRQIFLTRVAIQANLKMLKKCNYNICDPRVNKRNELLPLNLKLASIYFRAPIL